MKRYVAVLCLMGIVAGCGDGGHAPAGPLEPDRAPLTAAPGAAPAQTAGTAVIATDRGDYSPGDTVTFTGSGFQPFEIVTITLHEEPFAHADRVLADTADASGDFVNRDFFCEQHHLNVTFHVSASGSAGSYAETTFTDGARIQSVAVLGVQSPNPVTAGSVASYGTTSTNSLRVAFNSSLVGSCTVSLSATGLPAGATANFAPTVLSGTAGQWAWSFMTVNTSLITPGGTIVFTIRATGTGGAGNVCGSADTEISFAALSVLGNPATALSLATPSPAQVGFGTSGPVTFTAALTRTAGGAGVAGATVSFSVGGTAAGTAITNSVGVASLATYNPAALAPGSHTVLASFAGGPVGGTTLAASASGPQTLTVGKVTPEISWQNPASIIYGTSLSSAQLNASASVPGSFAYTPSAGTVLDAGNGQPLFVAFTPADATSYNDANRTVAIDVQAAPLSVIAHDQTKIQGGANPALTGTLTGVRNGDPISARYATPATTLSPPGIYPIIAALDDPGGRLRNYVVASTNGALTVMPNAPPVLGPVHAPAGTVPVGQPIAAAASFTDADVAESQPYTAAVDWGDGVVTTQSHDVPGTISATHAYAAPGVYTIVVSVRQDNLPSHADSERYEHVIVYEAGGSVTGGGWIAAPDGAPAPGRGPERATFGFLVRYAGGATVPSGNFEFHAHGAGINLRSDAFEWLVVEGPVARFQGTGSVNGRAGYGFLVTAIAGDPGQARLRIRIWDRATGSVVYDTQESESLVAAPQARLGGGSVRIRN